MSFGAPIALWFLPAALAPLFFHLLSRRNVKKIEFSDLTLLKAIEILGRPRARIREYLLVAARCGIIAALILAASEPRTSRAAVDSRGLDLVMLLDRSYSMRSRDNGVVRFDEAKRIGRMLLSQLGESDRIAFGVYDDAPPTTLSWMSRKDINRALEIANPGWRTTNTMGAVTEADRFLTAQQGLDRRGRERAIIVLGDGAAHGHSRESLAMTSGAQVFELSFRSLANAWIASATPPLETDFRVPKLEVEWKSSGKISTEMFDLWVRDRRSISAVSQAADGVGRLRLPLPPPDNPAAPLWYGKVKMAADALDVDNDAPFLVEYPPAPRVLILHSDPMFFRGGHAGWFMRELFGGGRDTLAGHDADFLDADRWNESDFGKYGVIIAADAGRPSPGLSFALQTYVEHGGGVWFIPSSHAAESDLNAYPWLPGYFANERKPSRGIRIVGSSQLVSEWKDVELDKVTFGGGLALAARQGAEIIAADARGSPLLVFGRHGEGRVVVWGTSFDSTHTNLGLKPLFVSLVDTCLRLSLPPQGPSSPHLLVGQLYEREWAQDEPAPRSAAITDPNGVTSRIKVMKRRLQYAQTQTPGVYEYEDDLSGGIKKRFIVDINRASAESDLSAAQRAPWPLIGPESFLRVVHEHIAGSPLTLLFLSAAVALLMLEMLLASPAIKALIIFLLIIIPQGASAREGSGFVWTQLKLGDSWDPYPDAPGSVLKWLNEISSVRAAPDRRVVELQDDDLARSPFLYFAGRTSPPSLSDDDVRRLRRYLSAGGFLWVEDSSGGPPSSFDRWIREQLGRAMPGFELKSIGRQHVLYKTFFLLPGPSGRIHVHGMAEGLEWGGRLAVLYTRDDVLGAWAQDAFGAPLRACLPDGEPQREQAKRTTVNIVMYALTGSYKEDAVHQAAILEKLAGRRP